MLRGTALVFLSRNLQKLVALLIQLLLARALDRAGVGAYALLVTAPTLVTTLATMGLGPAHVHLRGQKRLSIRQVLANALIGSVLFGIVSLVIFALIRPYLDLDLNNPLLMTMVSFTFPVVILQSYLDYLWVGEDRLGVWSLLYGLRYMTLPAFLLVGVIVPHELSDKYLGMAVALVANAVVTLLVSLYVVRREYGLGADFDRRSFSAATRYGARIQAGSVAQAIGYRFDYFLVNSLLDPKVALAATGLYAAATNLAESLWILPTTISTALLPRVSTRNTAAAREATARTCRVVFAFSVSAGAVLFLLAEVLLRYLYRPSFTQAAFTLRLLLIGTVVFSLQKVLANYFIGQGAAKWFQRATLISMTVNVVLNLWLIPLPGWGIKGAALASAVSYSLSTVILAALFVRWGRLRMRDLLIPTRSDIRELTSRLASLRRWAALPRHGRATR